jgi:hypothetical protein
MSDLFSSLLRHILVVFKTVSLNKVALHIWCRQYQHHSLSRVDVPATLHSISVNTHFSRFL